MKSHHQKTVEMLEAFAQLKTADTASGQEHKRTETEKPLP